MSEQPNNFVLNYWIGDYSLAESFWIVCWLGSMTLGLITVTLSRFPHSGLTAIDVLAWLAAIYVWIWVGLWRSAGRHGGVWGGLARMAIILGVLKFASELAA